MFSPQILRQAETFVRELYYSRVPRWRTFHNFKHTLDVVKQSENVASFYSLDSVEFVELILAAWFHDTGFSKSDTDHEWHSCDIAHAFLNSFRFDHDVMAGIKKLIMATKMPSHPTNLLEGILCDCDLHHLGSKDYADWSLLLKSEMEHQKNITYSENAWNNENILFFTSHRFFTEYAKANWEEQKQKNLTSLEAIKTLL